MLRVTDKRAYTLHCKRGTNSSGEGQDLEDDATFMTAERIPGPWVDEDHLPDSSQAAPCSGELDPQPLEAKLSMDYKSCI